MKKKYKLRLKNSDKIYEVAGRWGSDIVFTSMDEKDEECLIYSPAEVEELFQEVTR